jgi:hypothetical protein
LDSVVFLCVLGASAVRPVHALKVSSFDGARPFDSDLSAFTVPSDHDIAAFHDDRYLALTL